MQYCGSFMCDSALETFILSTVFLLLISVKFSHEVWKLNIPSWKIESQRIPGTDFTSDRLMPGFSHMMCSSPHGI